MQRRNFFKTAVLGSASAALMPGLNSPERYDHISKDAVSPIKITKISITVLPGIVKLFSIRTVVLSNWPEGSQKPRPV